MPPCPKFFVEQYTNATQIPIPVGQSYDEAVGGGNSVSAYTQAYVQ